MNGRQKWLISVSLCAVFQYRLAESILQHLNAISPGQVTTIWHDFHQTYSLSSSSLKEELQAAFSSAKSSLQNNILPVEKVMQNLYNNRMANRSNGGGCLTKKQIPRIAAQSSDPEHAEELLRNLVKVGEDRVSRLVDASLASDYLHTDFATGNEGIMRRILAATVLTEDAATGGRFRRRGCQFVEAHDDQQITLLNGGWIAVDASIKSGTEGRKFASLAEEAPSSTKQLKNSSTARVFTAADERIAQRLECLAMGDVWKESNLDSEQQRLELDVREALTRLNLPLSPDGAKAALIKIGRWSESDGKRNGRIEPWSSEVMDAARALALYENQRRDALAKVCFSTKNQAELEGRINLVALPCVCVDAQRATFRDDSIGLRMRSTTGRKVNKAASKWEVLIHIADVSDLYLSEEKATDGVMIPRRDGLDMEVLRGAAKRRGQSRYDLPLGEIIVITCVMVFDSIHDHLTSWYRSSASVASGCIGIIGPVN
jgi:exoribonuclease R